MENAHYCSHFYPFMIYPFIHQSSNDRSDDLYDIMRRIHSINQSFNQSIIAPVWQWSADSNRKIVHVHVHVHVRHLATGISFY